MSKTIGMFDYSVVKMKKIDGLPFNPHIVIELKSWGANANGTPMVSAQLITEAEINSQIEALKADLDAVGKRAKAALRRAQDETKAIVASKNQGKAVAPPAKYLLLSTRVL